MTIGRVLLIGAVVATGLSGCTLGDGEGPRFRGRVSSVSDTRLCVGPNSSSASRRTCDDIPAGSVELPSVGQCVSLFADFSDEGKRLTWTTTSLELSVKDSECQPG